MGLSNFNEDTFLKLLWIGNLPGYIGYSAGEFQALQLIVLAAFGVVD